MSKHKAENHEERLFTELILGLDGERDKHLNTLFEFVKDAITENHGEDKKLCFAYCMGLARVYEDMKVNYIEEGEQLSTENGWTLVYRDTDGYSLWYMADMDLLALQRAFHK